MGFFRKLLGGGSDSYSSSLYNPSTYTTSIGAPNVTTETSVSASEDPKKAEKADTKDYEEGERKRMRKRGVSGSFTTGMDTSGAEASSDSVGS